MPRLPCIIEANRAAVFDDVRQVHKLGVARNGEGARSDVCLQRSKAAREVLLSQRIEVLLGEAQHAEGRQRFLEAFEFSGPKRLGEI